ncbi:MAG: hypothetical protein NTY91_07930 [Euryarchaeota archaeon]|nr:hypothetical protein [Euryarchaeota archaeon]
MDKKPLIGISICAMVLLVLGSLSNVVGYQSVQSSNRNVIKERINQKELLFQTILDIANNKEIQDTTINSEITQLKNSQCDCENEKTTRLWDFRFICLFILFPLYIIIRAIEIHLPIYLPVVIMLIIGSFFHCFWAYWPLMR